MNKDYINQYEDYLKIDKKYSMNTVSSYTKDLIKFSNFIDKNILNVTKNDILFF